MMASPELPSSETTVVAEPAEHEPASASDMMASTSIDVAAAADPPFVALAADPVEMPASSVLGDAVLPEPVAAVPVTLDALLGKIQASEWFYKDPPKGLFKTAAKRRLFVVSGATVAYFAGADPATGAGRDKKGEFLLLPSTTFQREGMALKVISPQRTYDLVADTPAAAAKVVRVLMACDGV
jgi:hypothetical protein